MDPFDPRLVWLHAAEMTALLRQAVHEGGERHHLDAMLAARGVAVRLCAGEVDTPEMVRALSALDDAPLRRCLGSTETLLGPNVCSRGVCFDRRVRGRAE